MRNVTVKVQGIQPLLIHRFTEQSQAKKSTRKMLIAEEEPRDVAKRAANIAPDGTFYISAFAIVGALGAAGSNHKMTGSRKTVRHLVPSAVRIANPTITIDNGDGRPAKDFEVDSRPVTIPSTKGRIMRHRPRFDNWSLTFDLQIDETLLPVEFVHTLLNEAGLAIGIGDFRPEKRGPFGTFRVVSFG